jgi:pre-mRNA-splicing factor 38B
MGAYVRDLLLTHAYFETLFPRVPKPVADEIAAKLSARGLPPRAAGNAGQGGADRRGDAGAARPASVKASLSVAFGQRAPNRAGGREEGRGAWARADGSRDRRDDRGGWRDDRGRDHGYGDRGGYGGDRDRGRDRPRSRSPPRYRARSRSRSPPPPRR